jgi:hypothetical protein
MTILVADLEVPDEVADGFEDRVERIAIAGQDHPRRKRPSSLPPERVERHVGDFAGVSFAGARALDGLSDATGDALGNRLRKLRLEPRRGPEMVEQIGVSAPDLGGDGLQSDGLGSSAQK